MEEGFIVVEDNNHNHNIMLIDAELKVYREHPDAKMPEVAYEGTSACFDLFAIEDTKIPANSSAMVPVGVRLTIPEGFYVEFATRSGHGIKKSLNIIYKKEL